MDMTKAKLFWKIGDQTKKIITIPYNDDIEYYAFVRENRDAGYRQVIVTSEVIIYLIQKIVIDRFQVFEIEMTDNDDEFNAEISNLLERVDQNPACLSELMSLLSFLAEGSSIEIQRIKFKGRTTNDIAVMGFIQSNGLLGVSSEVFKETAEAISKEVRKFVFGCS